MHVATPEQDDEARRELHKRDICRRFAHKPPVGDQADRYALIRMKFTEVACTLIDLCPPSRELTIAMNKLDEGLYFSIAAIARNDAHAYPA